MELNKEFSKENLQMARKYFTNYSISLATMEMQVLMMLRFCLI